MTAETRPNSNVSNMINEHIGKALKHLETLKAHVKHLEEALNSSEIETRGVGIGWVHNVKEPLDSIEHHVTCIDTLAGVRTWN